MSTLTDAERLKKIRNHLGYSQREMADEFMVTSGAIAHWELGRRPIPGPIIRLISIYEETCGLQERDSSLINLESLSASQSVMREISNTLESEGLKPCEQEQGRLFKLLKDNFHLNFNEPDFKLNIKLKIFQRVIKSFGGSKGLSLKAAQIASFLEMGMSPEISKTIGNLLLQVEPMAFAKIEMILNEAYGSYEKVFKKVYKKPLAVTSLAELYRAELQDGTNVVIKIRDPEIEQTLGTQFRNLNFLSQIGGLVGSDVGKVVKDIESWVLSELDYEKEVYNQERFRNIFAHEPRIVIPPVFREHCRNNIIVLGYEPGISFEAFAARATESEKKEAAKLIAYFHSYAIFKHGLAHGDAHPGNFLFQDGRVIFLDYGRISEIEESLLGIEREFMKAVLDKNFEGFKSYFITKKLIKNPEQFDFAEYWKVIQALQAHHLTEKPFRISREHLRSAILRVRQFRERKQISYNTELLLASLVNMTLMSLFAELDVEVPWRKQALEILSSAD